MTCCTRVAPCETARVLRDEIDAEWERIHARGSHRAEDYEYFRRLLAAIKSHWEVPA